MRSLVPWPRDELLLLSNFGRCLKLGCSYLTLTVSWPCPHGKANTLSSFFPTLASLLPCFTTFESLNALEPTFRLSPISWLFHNATSHMDLELNSENCSSSSRHDVKNLSIQFWESIAKWTFHILVCHSIICSAFTPSLHIISSNTLFEFLGPITRILDTALDRMAVGDAIQGPN